MAKNRAARKTASKALIRLVLPRKTAWETQKRRFARTASSQEEAEEELYQRVQHVVFFCGIVRVQDAIEDVIRPHGLGSAMGLLSIIRKVKRKEREMRILVV